MNPKDINDNLLTPNDKLIMLDTNPYNTGWGKFEHDSFNGWYVVAFEAGVFSIIKRLLPILRKKGIEKEDIRVLINEALGKEILKKKEDERENNPVDKEIV